MKIILMSILFIAVSFNFTMDSTMNQTGLSLTFGTAFADEDKNRDKTVVITCNTGAWAGAGFFMMRYLGYPDVRVHDAAWVGWEEFVRYPGCGY